MEERILWSRGHYVQFVGLIRDHFVSKREVIVKMMEIITNKIMLEVMRKGFFRIKGFGKWSLLYIKPKKIDTFRFKGYTRGSIRLEFKPCKELKKKIKSLPKRPIKL